MAADASLAQRWGALRPWQRWLALYGALLAACVLVGLVPGVGIGNALFVAGALLILASLTRIRLGGERKKIIHRDIKGNPLFSEKVVSPDRRGEIQQGLGVFFLGVGLWAWLPVAYWLGL